MREKPQPDPVPTDDPPPHPAEPLQIDTPVIHMQDLEHQPAAVPRVSNKGVKVIPKLDSTDDRDFAKEDEDALLALEQIEKSLRGQLPG
jgi:pyruvate/2-oxoacid:ferredoxin oxidoreductase alpha subunit